MQASELMRGHSLDGLWAKAPELIAGCGAFPVRVGERLVATVSVSGLHDGGDHWAECFALLHEAYLS